MSTDLVRLSTVATNLALKFADDTHGLFILTVTVSRHVLFQVAVAPASHRPDATRTFFVFNKWPGLICYVTKSLTMRDAARDTG
jgi:hypothetical protein